MQVHCRDVQRWKQEAVDGDLAPRKREAFYQHLAACEACRVEYRTLLRVVTILSFLPKPAPKAAFTSKVLLQLRQARAARSSAPRPAAFWLVTALVVGTIAGIIVGWNEWVLPTLVSLTGQAVVLVAKSSRLLAPMVTLGGAFLALARSCGEVFLLLIRDSASLVISVYVLTLAVVMTSMLPASSKWRQTGANALCV